MPGYRDIAADLRRSIERGDLEPGATLPTIAQLAEQYGVAKGTANTAITTLANEGLVSAGRGRGATVRDRRPVRIPLSRYRSVMRPGDRGPWEIATAGQGLPGRMVLVGTARVDADTDQAATFGLPTGTPLVYRRRHAMINDDVVQIQQAWYPADLVAGTPLAEPGKVTGGAYAALVAAGHAPHRANEHVTATPPTHDEAAQLRTGIGLPVLRIKRITRDRDGLVLELALITTPIDRAELIYDDLLIEQG